MGMKIKKFENGPDPEDRYYMIDGFMLDAYDASSLSFHELASMGVPTQLLSEAKSKGYEDTGCGFADYLDSITS